MTRRCTIAIYAAGVIALAGVTFGIGFAVGLHTQEQRDTLDFEFRKSVAVVVAGDYLSKGQPDKALPLLFFAKAFEPRRGFTDQTIAEAYLADHEPCLALAFSDSDLRYREQHGLQSLPSHPRSLTLHERALQECKR
jgi:hypothetical protein